MGRMPRINVYIEDSLFYVTSQGDNISEIFRDEEDYRTYEGLLDKYKQQFHFQLFSYVLLPDRLHLLVGLPEGVTISQVMHAINSSYIKYFNVRYDRKGHLFKERFDLNVVEKSSNLLPLSAYIHVSPCRQELAKTPQEYSYSNYHNYTEGASQGEGREVIELLSQTTEYKRYEDFIANIEPEEMRIFGESIKKSRILGSQAFKRKVKEEVAMQERRQAKAQKPEINKKLVLGGIVSVVVLVIAAATLYMVNLGLKDEYKEALEVSEKETEENIKEAAEKVRRNLQERYEADMVSYEAMSKRLEREQQNK